MRSTGFRWIIAALMLLIDFYVFQAVKVVSQDAPPKLKITIYAIYWVVSITAIILLVLLPFLNYENWPRSVRTYVFATIVGLFFAKVIAVIFFMIDDLRRILQWTSSKLLFQNTEGEAMVNEKISRSIFLSWLGLAAGGGLFATLMYGFGNKYKYDLKKMQLSFRNLPAAFKGLKIIHISDIHAGSFNNKKGVEKGIEMILKQQPDLVLFTGDLVNDRATEMEGLMDIFSRIKAPLGVYSTLGNHDYGDYYWGRNPQGAAAIEKSTNMDRLKQVHHELGWKLLLDEHVVLEKNTDKIVVLGVQNISGKPNFSTYGSLQKAHQGSDHSPFKILLSHDPSHWDSEVRPLFPDVDLTLSGHTHGMQFGVELPGFKWSPVQYIYKQWAGLYENGHQKLYVNRGFGFIGYPGRVGILPEITLIELV